MDEDTTMASGVTRVRLQVWKCEFCEARLELPMGEDVRKFHRLAKIIQRAHLCPGGPKRGGRTYY